MARRCGGDSRLIGWSILYSSLSVIVRALGDHDFGLRIRRWPLISYCALLFVLLLSSFYSPSNSVFSLENTAGLFDRAFVFSLFWMAASQIQRESDLIIFAATSSFVSVALAGWVLWNAASLDFSAYRGGTSVNENYLSMVLFTGVAPLVYCLFTGLGRISNGLLLLLLVIMSASLILASRGILFAGAVASWL